MSLLERIYFFHGQILDHRYPNATDLMDEFEISSATAHRDINYLRDRLLAPIVFDQGRNGYAYEYDNFRLPFEDSPKVVLFLGLLNTLAAETGLAELPELQQLQKKLSSVALGGKKIDGLIHCEWVEIEPVGQEIFEQAITALLEQIEIEINYLQHDGQRSVRHLDPLKLINYQGRWYLLAWCHLRRERRLFHLSRIQHIALTQNPVHHRLEPDDPYLQGVFGIFKGTPQFSATIEFTGKAADIVRHQRWHNRQQCRETSRGIQFTLPVADDRELIMKVLQFGAQAKIISPPELQTKLQHEIEQMRFLYQEQPGPEYSS